MAILSTMLYHLHQWFRPTLVGLFSPRLGWNVRWRMLFVFQPVLILTNALVMVPLLFRWRRPYTVEYLPVWPKRSVRALVYNAPAKSQRVGRPGSSLRPLHVEIHAGAFIGGLPESTVKFDEQLARETGAVVVSITHRLAPEHPFPGAIDDIDATVAWIQDNAAERWGADPALMTIGGFSAGGNLALAATQQPSCQAPSPSALKAVVIYYGAIDLRLKAEQKPRGLGMPPPEKDPATVLVPLFDTYPGPVRAKHFDDPRLSPALAVRETLPQRILLVVPAMDILVAELLAFADRVNDEDKRAGWTGEPRVQVREDKEAFHGYLEVPSVVLKKGIQERGITWGVSFLKETYKLHGWTGAL
ncbi:Arylacetamide deacetylase-like [Paramyrothecium foliicola]|nr:Arylacetamide deacetylase-like [Paramyrothecium foliicola]